MGLINYAVVLSMVKRPCLFICAIEVRERFDQYTSIDMSVLLFGDRRFISCDGYTFFVVNYTFTFVGDLTFKFEVCGYNRSTVNMLFCICDVMCCVVVLRDQIYSMSCISIFAADRCHI